MRKRSGIMNTCLRHQNNLKHANGEKTRFAGIHIIIYTGTTAANFMRIVCIIIVIIILCSTYLYMQANYS